MAKVFASLPGMSTLMSYWYHFVIMFEALFILTLLETGTRVARFVFQDALTQFSTRPRTPGETNWVMNVALSLLTCIGWGYLLYTGNLTKLWQMLGIANQLLAAIALAVGTTYLLQHTARRRYALCTGIPFAFVITTTVWAGTIRVSEWWVEFQKPAVPDRFLTALLCILAAVMIFLTLVIAADAMRRWISLASTPRAGTIAPSATA
jgi:carbon starvation protein